ncbi:MAG: efflux transporter periplasmic adaptor subunit [Gammaproteobacteria bacterium]|nr:MAG: efflux transporter periplasmic adaptor subunit [Gammaproteobacteria bacterium]
MSQNSFLSSLYKLLRRIVILLIVTSLAVFWWWSGQAVTRYETQSISRGNIEAVVVAIGTLKPRYSVDVGAQVSGQIISLTVEPGSIVEKGQLLTEIDASLQQATVDAGRAQLAGQRAQLAERQALATLAKQQYNRQHKLAEQGATREEDVQSATADWKTSRARIDQLNAQINQTISGLKGDEAELGYTKIYAPMSGTVLSVAAKQGQTLNATYSTPVVLTLADLSTMTVQVNVAEADILYIKTNMSAWFSTLGNDRRRWHGTVRQVLPAPPADSDNAKTVFYTVLFDVDNSDGVLMSGMTAQVSFVTTFAENVLIAPRVGIKRVISPTSSTAKPEEFDMYSVQTLDSEGKPQSHTIKAGRKDSLNVEVLEGLDSNSNIIVRTIEHKHRRDLW